MYICRELDAILNCKNRKFDFSLAIFEHIHVYHLLLYINLSFETCIYEIQMEGSVSQNLSFESRFHQEDSHDHTLSNISVK